MSEPTVEIYIDDEWVGTLPLINGIVCLPSALRPRLGQSMVIVGLPATITLDQSFFLREPLISMGYSVKGEPQPKEAPPRASRRAPAFIAERNRNHWKRKGRRVSQ